jgi:hypothetical protein
MLAIPFQYNIFQKPSPDSGLGFFTFMAKPFDHLRIKGLEYSPSIPDYNAECFLLPLVENGMKL